MRMLIISILSVVFLTTLNGNSKESDKDIKYFAWTGFVTHDGKLDLRMPMSLISIKKLVNKGVDGSYYEVSYINKKPKQVTKYLVPNNQQKEITLLNDEGIVTKTITFDNNETNSSLSCNYIYKTFDIKYKRVNTKKCDNGLKEVIYYNISGIYKRIRFRNERLQETMTYKSPYCYYFDANNSLNGIEACILEPDNVPLRLFTKPE